MVSQFDEVANGGSDVQGEDGEFWGVDGIGYHGWGWDGGGDWWWGYQQWRSTAVVIGGLGKAYTNEGVLWSELKKYAANYMSWIEVIIFELWTCDRCGCGGSGGGGGGGSGDGRSANGSGFKIKNLSAELFADFGQEPYFEACKQNRPLARQIVHQSRMTKCKRILENWIVMLIYTTISKCLCKFWFLVLHLTSLHLPCIIDMEEQRIFESSGTNLEKESCWTFIVNMALADKMFWWSAEIVVMETDKTSPQSIIIAGWYNDQTNPRQTYWVLTATLLIIFANEIKQTKIAKRAYQTCHLITVSLMVNP